MTRFQEDLPDSDSCLTVNWGASDGSGRSDVSKQSLDGYQLNILQLQILVYRFLSGPEAGVSSPFQVLMLRFRSSTDQPGILGFVSAPWRAILKSGDCWRKDRPKHCPGMRDTITHRAPSILKLPQLFKIYVYIQYNWPLKAKGFLLLCLCPLPEKMDLTLQNPIRQKN